MDNFEKFLKDIKDIHTIDEAKDILFSLSSKFDKSKISFALDFAIKAHEGQKRKSGEPYIIHPILVAAITTFFSDNEDMIIAAILHDVVEDTPYTIEDIEKNFGPCVRVLVEGLTKITQIRQTSLIPSNSDEKLTKSALTFKNMLVSSIKDVRVLIIKLCDRLHNMLTLDALPEKKQKRIAEETLVVYTPIAHRLGISKLKNTLEDLAFYYLLPEEYKKIDEFIKSNKESFDEKLNQFVYKIETLLLKYGFTQDSFEIQKRIKHYYSIYLKMQRKGISIEEVLDLLAIRILLKDKISCYKALGITHINFRPIISRFKDYIALPKENGYQTIHTTVFDKQFIFEVQIRTYDMHKNAELGIAAHWKYKLDAISPNLEWLNNLQYQTDNIVDSYELAKNDLYSEDIIVYSPKFDIFTLPKDSTALDFAYMIHTDVGNKAKAAYINKQPASLLTILKNGDIVRIVTDKEEIPRCSWIDNLRTSKAKLAQKHLCNERMQYINKALTKNIISHMFNIDDEEFEKITSNLKFDNLTINKINGIIAKIQKQRNKNSFLNIFSNYKLKKYVFNNIEIYHNKVVNNINFSYCCHPKYGDEIIGFYDKKSVEIHHKLCSTAEKKLSTDIAVFATWVKHNSEFYNLVVSLPNKTGELAKFVTFLAKLNVNITKLNLGNNEDIYDYCEVVIEIPSKQKDNIIQKIKSNYKIIEFISLKDPYNQK